MILYIQLHKEIGLKSSKVVGFFDLGIRAMKAALSGSCICPFFLDSSTTFKMSFPKTSKKPK
jgi:hypothetical protein